MHTARLPTERVLVAATRCQYRWRYTIGPGINHPYPHYPLDILTLPSPWTYPSLPGHTHPLLMTRGGHHWRHTHPLPLWTDRRNSFACGNNKLLFPLLLLVPLLWEIMDLPLLSWILVSAFSSVTSMLAAGWCLASFPFPTHFSGPHFQLWIFILDLGSVNCVMLLDIHENFKCQGENKRNEGFTCMLAQI